MHVSMFVCGRAFMVRLHGQLPTFFVLIMLNLGSSFGSFCLFRYSLREFHFVAFPSVSCFSFPSFSRSVQSMDLSPYLLCPPCHGPCWREHQPWRKQAKSSLSWSLPLLGRQRGKDKLNRWYLSEKSKGRSKEEKKIDVWGMLLKFYTVRMTSSRMWLWNTDFLLVGYKGGGAGSSFPPAGKGLSLVATVLRTWAWSLVGDPNHWSTWRSLQKASSLVRACSMSSLSHLRGTEHLKMGF